MAEADLSKVISVIMENPTLIEEIRKTLTKAEISEEKGDTPPPVSENAAENELISEPSEPSVSTYAPKSKSKRNDLLRAMRPYLSKERGRAIESMISVADILFALKEK